MITMFDIKIQVVAEHAAGADLDAIGHAIADAVSSSDGKAFGSAGYKVTDWSTNYTGHDETSES